MPTWRALVVDDKLADEVAELISGNKVLADPDQIECIIRRSFSDAIPVIENERVDLVVLDLKDDDANADAGESAFPGKSVFDQIREKRFIPIVFYTAWPKHAVEVPKPFVKVVTKGDPENLRQAIREVFDTRLPQLVRHLEAAQREYMWDFVEQHWQQLDGQAQAADLTYLLARRLAAVLRQQCIREFLKGTIAAMPDIRKAHPMDFYVYPPLPGTYFAADIVQEPGKENAYWVLLTPSCDFEWKKVEHVLLAKCEPLEARKEVKSINDAREKEQEPPEGAINKLSRLLKDDLGQKDRFKFLPGTFFVPNLLVDFQQLRCVSVDDFIGRGWKVVASLDTPFAESLVSTFTRFYGRLGTPDLDVQLVLRRLGIAGENHAYSK